MTDGSTARPDVDVVVIGAGVAGLVVAATAARAGLRVVVLESGDRVGGLLRGAELGGQTIDVGAESFATRTSGVADLVAELSLPVELIAPAEVGGAHVAFRDAAAGGEGVRRAPLPHRAVLGIPAEPGAPDVVRILGDEGAARAAAEARIVLDPEPSLGDLVSRTLGPLLTERLVDPLCRSVYSVPAADARLSRLHPGLWREYRERGSLRAAVAALATPARAGSAIGGIRGGMWRLADALRDTAAEAGAEIRTGTPVTAVRPQGDGVRVLTDAGTITASRAVVATGAQAAATLVGDTAPSAAHRPGGEATVPPEIRVVAALVHSDAFDRLPVGTGVIAAADVPSAAKALTHVTAKWEWAAAGFGPGHHVFRLSARGPQGLDDAAGIAADIALLTGVGLDADDVQAWTTVQWPDAVARPAVSPEHRDALAAAGITLAGAAEAGTGLASVIPHARALAHSLVADVRGRGEPLPPSAPTSAWRTA